MPWLRFLGIQLLSALLTLIGIPLIAILLAMRLTRVGTSLKGGSIRLFRGGWATYLWNNYEDGIDNHGQSNAFVWSALRNPVDNLKYVTAWGSGPFVRKEFSVAGKLLYVQAGWNPWSHLIQCSAGSVNGASWEWPQHAQS